jgi:hypothetical protein
MAATNPAMTELQSPRVAFDGIGNMQKEKTSPSRFFNAGLIGISWSHASPREVSNMTLSYASARHSAPRRRLAASLPNARFCPVCRRPAAACGKFWLPMIDGVTTHTQKERPPALPQAAQV